MEIEVNAESISLHRLRRLSTWLNYEISTSALIILSYAGYFLMLLAVIAALIFTPFLLYTLIAERKTGWLITFLIIVIIPFVTIALLIQDNNYFYFTIPLAFFYFFNVLLKLSVNEEIKELSAAEQWRREDAVKKLHNMDW